MRFITKARKMQRSIKYIKNEHFAWKSYFTFTTGT